MEPSTVPEGAVPYRYDGDWSLGAERRFSLLLVVLVEDQLGLRDDGGEFAVAASDARLQHDGRAAAVQRHADRMRGIALWHGGKEIGLALDGRGAATGGKTDARRDP